MRKLEIDKNKYIGKKYGRLEVLDFYGYDKFKHGQWIFKCDCGNIKILTLADVKRGNIKSCGCILKEGIGYGEAAFNEVYNTYKRRALKKNIRFDISKREFREITNNNCFYCGSVPSNRCTKSSVGEYIYNGLDRLDSSKGYTLNNIVPCCIKCNESKMNLSTKEFYLWIEKAYKFMRKNKSFFLNEE